jgi:ABC-type transporter Mla maintaining outer membrane lipid asymmetry ATPase subunit MlaF
MAEPQKNSASSICLQMKGAALGEEHESGEPLLKDINWVVRSGEMWVVTGLHRTGKSTLLSSVAMLQKPLAGEIEVFGVNPWSEGEEILVEQRLRIGLVFESGSRLLHQLTIGENVALPVCYHKDCSVDEAEQRVAELLEFVGVLPMANQRPGSLSRIFRQRASLARALALSPEMLLLDNPLAAMDPRERAWWLETVTALSKGHPIVGGKPLTIILTADDARPWLEAGRLFALLHENSWRTVGGMQEALSSSEPLLKEIFN